MYIHPLCGTLQVPEAEMPYLAGYEETGFLNNLQVTIDDIEFLANNCTKVRIFWLNTDTVWWKLTIVKAICILYYFALQQDTCTSAAK